MNADDEVRGARLALAAAGVGVVIDAARGSLPAIVAWGGALPGLDSDQVDLLCTARVPLVGSNNADVPLRVALLPEHHAGWVGRPGLTGSRGGRYWSPRFTTTEVRLDGADVTGFAAAGAARVEVAATDVEAELELLLTLELLPTGLLRSRAELTNRADEPYQLDDLVLAYPVPAEATELLDFGRPAQPGTAPAAAPVRGRHPPAAEPQGPHRRRQRVRAARRHARLRLRRRRDPRRAHRLERQPHPLRGARVHRGAGAGRRRAAAARRDPAAPRRVLPQPVALRVARHRPGRRSPGGSTGTCGPPAAGLRDRPVTLNVWEAVYFDHDLDRLLELAERAAAIGVERYVLDDGWFGARRHDRAGLGDWVVSPDVWPDGLHPLIDRVRDARHAVRALVRAGDGQRRLRRGPGAPRVDHVGAPRSGRSSPATSRCSTWASRRPTSTSSDQMLALLDEYDIGYIKWDHNRDLIEAGTAPDGGRPGVHAQTLAFYRLVDELKAAHPGLEIESCSSGGARIDLGVLERTERVWVSDCIDPHERQHMLRWTGQLIPPEYLGSHIASGRSHTTGRHHDLGFRAGTAIFGHLGIEWDLSGGRGRGAGRAARVDHLLQATPRAAAGRRDGPHGHRGPRAVGARRGRARPAPRAIFAMATMTSSVASTSPPLRLRGLDPERAYRLRPLIVGGVPVRLDQPPRWWGGPAADGSSPRRRRTSARPGPREVEFPGSVFSGAALEHTGLASPILHPDQVLLLHAEALEN